MQDSLDLQRQAHIEGERQMDEARDRNLAAAKALQSAALPLGHWLAHLRQEDSDARVDAALCQALVDRVRESDVRKLAELMADPSDRVRRGAAQALGNVSLSSGPAHEPARKAVLSGIQARHPGTLKPLALAAAALVKGGKLDAESILHLQNESDASISHAVEEALIRNHTRKTDERCAAIQKRLEAAEDPWRLLCSIVTEETMNWSVSEHGARAVVALVGSELLPALTHTLDEADPNLRALAAYALGKLGADARPARWKLLRRSFDRDIHVACQAREARALIRAARRQS